ncbi:MAG: response regulator [Deltaproteobacteria bacterium]|nr:response regulator [Deltaproteobacteria bacterium]
MKQRSAVTVLVVEDDANDVLLLKRAFRKAGTEPFPVIHVVNDGESAVRYLGGVGEFGDRRSHPLPDLVLLDLKLPRMSGHEVLAWRSEQLPLIRIPVIVMSSSQEASDIARAYDCGANSYLVKPVELEVLVEIIGALQGYWLRFNETAAVTEPRTFGTRLAT